MMLLKWIAIWAVAGTLASVLIGSLIRMGMTTEPEQDTLVHEDVAAPDHAVAAF